MSPSLSTHLRTFFSKRAVRRSLIGAAAFLLAFHLFVYGILPAILKSQAQQWVADKLHREATIGAVEFDPYALALTVRDVKLTEPQGGAAFAGFEALRVNLALQSALHLAPVV